MTPHHYLDFNVVEFRRKRQEALEEKQKAETYVQRMLEMKERKRQKAALTIQRVFRGYVKRRQISYFLKLRHEFLDLRELEMPIRESAWYIILEYFGYAPPLKSDTVMERAQKLFPGYMRHIISACIEDNWKIACNYIRELDAHSHHEAMKVKDRLRKESRKLSSKGATASAPVTFRWLEALINVFRVWKAQSNHDAGAKRAAREKRKLEQMVENYRTVSIFCKIVFIIVLCLNGIYVLTPCIAPCIRQDLGCRKRKRKRSTKKF